MRGLTRGLFYGAPMAAALWALILWVVPLSTGDFIEQVLLNTVLAALVGVMLARLSQ